MRPERKFGIMQASEPGMQTYAASGHRGGDLNAAEARNLAYLVSWRLSELEESLMSAQVVLADITSS